MTMLQRAKMTAMGVTFAIATALMAKLPLPDPIVFKDKQPINALWDMSLEGSKLKVKTNNPVQGPATYIDTLEYSTPIQVAYNQSVKLGLGEPEMQVVSFDLGGQQIKLQAVDSNAAIQSINLTNGSQLTYALKGQAPSTGDYAWSCSMAMGDRQPDGSYLVQLDLKYNHIPATPYNTYPKYQMRVDTLVLPLGMEYATFTGTQVQFLFKSRSDTTYLGVGHLSPYVELTSDATFPAIRAQSIMCPDVTHGDPWVYPVTLLVSHHIDPQHPHDQNPMYQDADPQCSIDNSIRKFYQAEQSFYTRTNTSQAWMLDGAMDTFPYKDDSKKRGPPAFVLNQDSTHYICFGFKPYADSTNSDHIFYPFYPLIRVMDMEKGQWVASSPSEIKYNYADVKIVSPDSLIYTISSGDLFGTWHQKDSLVPTGVNEPSPAQKESMNVYPNPATQEATIQMSPSNESRTFYVFDALGRMVSEFGINAGEEQHRLNLEAFPAGIYFITGKRNGEKAGMMVVE